MQTYDSDSDEGHELQLVTYKPWELGEHPMKNVLREDAEGYVMCTHSHTNF